MNPRHIGYMYNLADAEDGTMLHKLYIAKRSNCIAEDSIVIELEARCRAADALERIASTLEGAYSDKRPSPTTTVGEDN
ncbi:hypothetical protein [Bifidobacterium sp. SO4]|uniref:hypothetical protein n=1 Tax=Bifidobacterium sp. SO4 TaxID=2809030 RepID=UPI001BDD1F8D|nr:hypothetical protein [Bifidobacterium sp. SO4]MBT1169603.1 hypothetical protein [Bifidobacterium sp. SO4]